MNIINLEFRDEGYLTGEQFKELKDNPVFAKGIYQNKETDEIFVKHYGIVIQLNGSKHWRFEHKISDYWRFRIIYPNFKTNVHMKQ